MQPIQQNQLIDLTSDLDNSDSEHRTEVSSYHFENMVILSDAEVGQESVSNLDVEMRRPDLKRNRSIDMGAADLAVPDQGDFGRADNISEINTESASGSIKRKRQESYVSFLKREFPDIYRAQYSKFKEITVNVKARHLAMATLRRYGDRGVVRDFFGSHLADFVKKNSGLDYLVEHRNKRVVSILTSDNSTASRLKLLGDQRFSARLFPKGDFKHNEAFLVNIVIDALAHENPRLYELIVDNLSRIEELYQIRGYDADSYEFKSLVCASSIQMALKGYVIDGMMDYCKMTNISDATIAIYRFVHDDSCSTNDHILGSLRVEYPWYKIGDLCDQAYLKLSTEFVHFESLSRSLVEGAGQLDPNFKGRFLVETSKISRPLMKLEKIQRHVACRERESFELGVDDDGNSQLIPVKVERRLETPLMTLAKGFVDLRARLKEKQSEEVGEGRRENQPVLEVLSCMHHKLDTGQYPVKYRFESAD